MESLPPTPRRSKYRLLDWSPEEPESPETKGRTDLIRPPPAETART